LQTTPESRLRKANPFVVDNDSIACSLGLGFRFITAKRLPSFVQHSSRFHGVDSRHTRRKLHAGADCGRLPVKPKNSLGGKMHTENHRCRT